MVRGQSITFGSRPSQVTRRGTSRNCHAETYISLSPGACQRGRLRHLFCDLDISALYPLPRIPSCLSRLSLSRPPSPHPLLPPCLPRSERERESRRCHSNIWFTVPLNRVPAAPPFFGKPSPRPNSCHGRARVCITSLFSPLLSSRFAYLDKVWGRLDSADRIGVAFFF